MAVVIKVGETEAVSVDIGEKVYIQGDPGFSPIVEIEEIPRGHRITIISESGSQSFDVMDGDGKGITSTVLNADYTLTIRYTDGTSYTTPSIRGATGATGPAGTDGTDGVSPDVTIAVITGGHRVTITDAEHPSGQSFDVMDGDGSLDPYTSNPADLAAAASPGSASQYSRGDHVHKLPTAAQVGAYVKPADGIPASDLAYGVIPSVPSASSASPAMDGTASPGISGSWARGDHVHPKDTSKQAKITASGILKGNGSGSVSAAVAGTDYLTPATNYSRVGDIASATYNLSSSDIGKTLITSWTMRGIPITVNLTQAISQAFPVGTEIAIVNFFRTDITISTTGLRICLQGINGPNAGGLYIGTYSFKITESNSLIALKKVLSSDTNGDAWILTGNVEVVS